jgi:hypothetical protein
MLRGIARIQRYNTITTKNYISPVKPTGQTLSIDFLLIGGGGGGGGFVSYPNYYQEAGGGGAGGYISGSGIIDIGYLYTVTVGSGGPGGSNTDNGTNGGISSIVGVTLTTGSAFGGGGGGSGYGSNGVSGASGGGGGRVATTGAAGAAGIPGQGNAGADSPGFALGGGGGGAGAPATNQNGGGGLAFSISGSSVTYAGGGGGGATNPQGSFGLGGAGGGGNGGDNNTGTDGKSGTANTGGGGGGAGGFGGVVGTGGTGGSGVVIISYTSSFVIFSGGQISQYTQIVPITSASLLFNGTSSYLTTGANSLTSENFVMECWFFLTSNLIYVNQSGAYQATIMAGTVANAFWFNISGSTSTPDTIYIDQMGGVPYNGPRAVASNLNISINTWHHIAVGRSGSSFSIWFNGVSQTITTDRITGSYNAGTITVGYNNNSPNYRGWFPGYISNLRIVKGNTLPYTVGASNITVPKEPLTNITGTYLLLNTTAALPFKDSSTNNFTVTKTNVTTSSIQPNFYNSYAKVVHKFTSTGLLSGSIGVEYLVVAGGGSGGGWGSPWDTGGGGAGGLLTGGTNFTPGNLYTIVVGAGATGGAGRDVDGSNGFNSSVSGGGISLTCYGGGGGGLWAGYDGGSGGGVSGQYTANNPATYGRGVYPGSTYIDAPRQGYDGGVGTGNVTVTFGGSPGGGGGAGSAGSDRNGGVGVTSSITGSSVTYAAGGYGGGGLSGNANTGNGGAGGTWNPNIAGGSGGSGIVVLRYASTYSDPISTSGSPTITNAGGYKTFVWTSTGSIQF